MADLKGKNILICCNLKKERVLLFNYFDSNEAGMIYTAKDIENSKKILNSEEIDCLLVECSSNLVKEPKQLYDLIKNFPSLSTVLLINNEMEIPPSLFVQFKQIADVVLIHPLSKLEIEIKFSNLYSKDNAPNKKTFSPIEEKIFQNDDSSEKELWNVFFYDSIQAKIIVDANSKIIIKVNEKFLDVFKLKESDIVGQIWNILDDKSNHIHYKHYIKEINSKDYTRFGIKHCLKNEIQNFNCLYQIGVLEGEIVFIGDISYENITGVSIDVQQNLNVINHLQSNPELLLECLDKLRSYLNYSFVIYFEFEENKLLKPLVSGDKSMAKKFLEKSLSSLLPTMNSNKVIQVDRDNNQISEYIEVLDVNSLQSFCVYPIFHDDKTYGTIVVAGMSPKEDWDTTSILLTALANQCKFNLFQKNIIQQREVDGRIDKLTGLPNRNAMTDKLAKVIEDGINTNAYISLLIIDVDKINYFNKNLGIELTNQIIVNVSKIIMNLTQKKGIVYRLSGDEFMILLKPHLEKKLVEYVAIDLIDKLNKPLLISNGDDVCLEFNIGASVFPDDGQTVSSMMKNADLAMYDAKLVGKNNYVIFKHSETGQALKQKIELEENLKIAIQNNYIKVFFQPKINAMTEDIVGFEALVRWIDPKNGMINPGQFIQLAEETGLINKIGELVTKRSCEMIDKWQKQFGLLLSCSINLSPVQLLDEMLPKKLENIIDESGLHPHYIDFEITETMNLDEIPNLVESLNKIVEIGCTLSIDDFGTGHSSLDYVKRIPATFIKIDQSFVKNIGLNPEDEAILDATISIAKRLDRKLIAEGVETEEQREYLLERECEFFQGFLFAKPLSEDEIEKLLDQRVKLMGTS